MNAFITCTDLKFLLTARKPSTVQRLIELRYGASGD